MNDCPNCEIGKITNGRCPRCDWTAPNVRPVDKPTPNWELPNHLRDPEPLTPEESAELKSTLANLYAKFGSPVEKLKKVTLEGMVKRCPACESPETGRFIHGGVRYCVTCYGKL